MEKELKCCYLMSDGFQCGKKAEYEISENTRKDIDNYTHSCEDHLGKMIGTTDGFSKCEEWVVRVTYTSHRR